MELVLVHSTYMATKAKKPEAVIPTHFLRAWREHHKLTLEVAGPKVGITHATLSRIETGKLPYNQKLLERLAWLYQCTVTDLLRTDPNK